jgi:cyclopropane-fatty-acyl-phospholipid synthase
LPGGPGGDSVSIVLEIAARSVLRQVQAGRVEIVDGPRRHSFGPPGADLEIEVRVNSPRFWRDLLRGSAALGEAYGDGAWDCDDLVALVRIGAREMPRIDRLRRPFVPLTRLASRVPRNTITGARRNISAHYDLGNDLFSLFLDETMTYSCAHFDSPDLTLREAQEAKLDRICRMLALDPGDRLVEVGTGWGALAVHAASNYGCAVTTTTLSAEQRKIALERVHDAGLEDRVTVLLEDYRALRGRFDKLVSIEMIEGVGWQYFDTFFHKCSDLLEPDGLMLLQAIVFDDRAYAVEKASRSFMKTIMFPGGCVPSVEVIQRCLARSTDLRPIELEDITGHYAETTRHWRERFLANSEQVAALGYDRRFRRMWELYLAWVEGGFRERRIRDVRMLLAKPAYRAAPWSVSAGERLALAHSA